MGTSSQTGTIREIPLVGPGVILSPMMTAGPMAIIYLRTTFFNFDFRVCMDSASCCSLIKRSRVPREVEIRVDDMNVELVGVSILAVLVLGYVEIGVIVGNEILPVKVLVLDDKETLLDYDLLLGTNFQV